MKEEEKEKESQEILSMVLSHADGHHWVEEFPFEDDERFGKYVKGKLDDRAIDEVILRTRGLVTVGKESRSSSRMER